MDCYICQTCGTQFAQTPTPPEHCPICEDERQYVGHNGQRWSTLAELHANHHSVIKEQEPNLIGIGTEPRFAIGQRALLIQTPHGNVLWDCISLLDDTIIDTIQNLGGLAAIAISHPHYDTSMVEWSHAFGGIPIYLHAGDRKWVMRPDPAIVFWEGATHELVPGITLIHCDGHFAGATVLHWADGANGRGALLTGDILYVVEDRRYVTFMYSYPNYIPLSGQAVQYIMDAIEPYGFDRIYSAWFERIIPCDDKAATQRSAERYLQALSGTLDGGRAKISS
ncbi:MAG: MBL fold metallo-hydrolase [Chloroflexi bacterium AL-W]|nr:MBL fold metallo-hydrolase [Chloroflexi bacterium AL-N1]NOK67358.1 MBL fold metallo-hydrolase [Chloroflexi bacterium AL-N10]NOK75150.1 MBL fold metallo-hydrolase [Chloroflexi bacterium AL-N5]NOK81938.1 MBL fold metallo-hydrolase [Chloroflexi bacterium AL-W]NOK89783.1 MBL fold metallo-hydrolase [Chloroflexi bacterium AL-N15]